MTPPQLLAAAAVPAVAAYLAGAVRLRRRGDAWPRARDASFTAGGAVLAVAAAAPHAGPHAGPFTAHMVQHLAAGMAAPLLLVLARPLTLALRALRPGRPRRALLAAAHSRPARWLVLPPVAAVLHVGGLWVLYRTPLWVAAHGRPALHTAVHLHLFAAGLLFGLAVCRLDPVRIRWGPLRRGAVLLLAGAAHAALAKSLCAAPPPGGGIAAADLCAGAALMYYGGDLVELALGAVLAAQWYTAAGRAAARRQRAVAAGTGHPGRARARPCCGPPPSAP